MERQLFKHVFNENVRWGDCDMLGHVNNTNFLRYIESARVAYIYDVMGDKLHAESVDGWVIVDLHCAFRTQLTFPAKLEVCSRIVSIGNSSAKMEAAIFIDEQELAAFTSTATIVWCNYSAGKSSRIPENFRIRIQDYENISKVD